VAVDSQTEEKQPVVACYIAKAKEKTMKNRKLWMGILAVALAFGMTVVGCDLVTANGMRTKRGGGSTPIDIEHTLYNPTGTWNFTISGQNTTVTVTENTWVFDSSESMYNDSGTFTQNGNVATLFSDTWETTIGTATLTSNTTMTITLYSPSLIVGTFNGTKTTWATDGGGGAHLVKSVKINDQETYDTPCLD
jgi:hypothetical protein